MSDAPAEPIPPDAFEEAIRRAEEWDRLLEADPKPTESWRHEDPLAPTESGSILEALSMTRREANVVLDLIDAHGASLDPSTAVETLRELTEREHAIEELIDGLAAEQALLQDHHGNLARESLIATANLARAQNAKALQGFLIDFASLMSDLASVKSFVDDLKKTAELKQRVDDGISISTEQWDMLEPSVVARLDGAFEALKDLESAVNTVAAQVDDDAQSPIFNDILGIAPALDQATGGNPLVAVQTVKSHGSDIVNIINDARENGVRIDWSNVGQLAVRFLKSWAEADQQLRQIQIDELRNSIAATDRVLATPLLTSLDRGEQRHVAVDALDVVRMARTTLQSTLAEIAPEAAGITSAAESDPGTPRTVTDLASGLSSEITLPAAASRVPTATDLLDAVRAGVTAEGGPTARSVVARCAACQDLADELTDARTALERVGQKLDALRELERERTDKQHERSDVEDELEVTRSVLRSLRSRRADVTNFLDHGELDGDIADLIDEHRRWISRIDRLTFDMDLLDRRLLERPMLLELQIRLNSRVELLELDLDVCEKTKCVEEPPRTTWWTTGRTALVGGVAVVTLAGGAYVAATARGDDSEESRPSSEAQAEPAVDVDDAVPNEAETSAEDAVIGEEDPELDENPEASGNEASNDGVDASANEESESGEIDRISAPFPIRALGGVPSIQSFQDDPVGQTGSFDDEWLQTPDVDIVRFTPWTANILDDVLEQLLTNTSFPCGAITDDYIVTCPLASPDVEQGEFFVVAVELGGPIQSDGAWRQYGLAFDDDGDAADNYFGVAPFDLDMFNNTEYWYRYLVNPNGERYVVVERFFSELGAQGLTTTVSSAATVIEFPNAIVWVVPRSEVPGPEPVFRATAFRNELDPDQIPGPATSGGDVTGIDVSTTTAMPSVAVAAELNDDVPPDADGTGQERADIAPDQRQQALLVAEVDELATRMTTAFADGDLEAVRRSLHFLSTETSSDGCVSFVERIFSGAQSITFEVADADPLVSDFLLGYVVDATVMYPTGINEYPITVASNTDLRMAPVFSCDQ